MYKIVIIIQIITVISKDGTYLISPLLSIRTTGSINLTTFPILTKVNLSKKSMFRVYLNLRIMIFDIWFPNNIIRNFKCWYTCKFFRFPS